MRNFLLTAAGLTYPAQQAIFEGGALDPAKLGKGQIVILNKGGEAVISSSSPTLRKNEQLQLVLGQGTDKPLVVIPFSPKHFTYSHMKYADGVKFSANVGLSDPTSIGEYTLILVKKGVPFNERNKWTVTIYLKDTTNADASTLSDKLVTELKKYEETLGLEFTDNGGDFDINVTDDKDFTDWEIKFADNLSDFATIDSITNAELPLADDKMIENMASKAAADAGYHDTYQDGGELMRPNYPIKLYTVGDKFDHFDVITIRCTEARDSRTKDDLVHQIIQIAIPMTYDADDSDWYSAPAIYNYDDDESGELIKILEMIQDVNE